MRPSPRRISLIAAALSLLASAVPAQAVEYLCGDICQCWVGCTRRCTDDISGYSTTCGAAGYPCNGQCRGAALLASDATVPADGVALPAGAWMPWSEACATVPATAPVVSAQP